MDTFHPQQIKYCAMHAVHLGLALWAGGLVSSAAVQHGLLGDWPRIPREEAQACVPRVRQLGQEDENPVPCTQVYLRLLC